MSSKRLAIAFAIWSAGLVVTQTTLEGPILSRGGAIAVTYLVLVLTEIVPPFVPTLLLLVATPLLLGSLGPRFGFGEVLEWTADPVIALFAGGLALGAAGHRHGIDGAIAKLLVVYARGDSRRLLGLTMLGTAVLSMWMSNIAAAGMILAVLRPLLEQTSLQASLRRGLLLGVAVGANVGGIATPIGTGPNALAIAAVAPRIGITFLHWMVFAVPLVLGLLAVGFLMLLFRYRVTGTFEVAVPEVTFSPRSRAVMAVFALAVTAWLSEPLHGISAPHVALAVTLVLFGSGLLGRSDLNALDWSTLGLIAGGITLGQLLSEAGVFALLAHVDWSTLPRVVWLGTLVGSSAGLSAVMSNTGTAALLIPLGLAVDPSPSTAVLIAIAASFGMPFSISTPPNAMAYGEGGLTNADLMLIGGTLMLLGCVLVTFTGDAVLHLLGVP